MTEAVVVIVAVLVTAAALLAVRRMRRPRPGAARSGRVDDAAGPPADHVDPAQDDHTTDVSSPDHTAEDWSSDHTTDDSSSDHHAEGSSSEDLTARGLSFPGAMSEDDGERLDQGHPDLGATSVVPHATERDRAGVNGIGPVLGDLLAADQKGTPLSLDATIQKLLTIEGATGAAVIDSESGMALAQGGSPGFDLGIAAAGNSNVVRAKLATMTEIGLDQKINDILITLAKQYHLINVLDTPVTQGRFIYLVLDRTRANLALARHRLAAVAPSVEV
ncbi:MAG: hypothetical protein ACRCY9_10905 [Phycicoccus sp.]